VPGVRCPVSGVRCPVSGVRCPVIGMFVAEAVRVNGALTVLNLSWNGIKKKMHVHVKNNNHTTAAPHIPHGNMRNRWQWLQTS
jgi:hypothetical protein